MDPLSGQTLKQHVQAIAGEIGPRPAGHPQEAQAREAIRQRLAAASVQNFEMLSFRTPDTWGYGTTAPLLLALVGNLLAPVSGILAGVVVLAAAYEFWKTMKGRMLHQLFYRFYPQRQGGTLIARIAPQQEIKHRAVLIGHVDTNKHRLSFSPLFKRGLRLSTTSLFAAVILNGLAALFGWELLRVLTAAYIIVGTLIMLVDETGKFVDGANDNASAVACLLGIGQRAADTPLKHTELWLAFTGSEEISHNGLNALLDRHGAELRDAWFIDFEMVGKGDIYYARQHTGLLYFTGYRPDPESLALADQTAAAAPELNVTARDIVILDEVATLRRRGYRGICLVGIDRDGFSANWHQNTDTVSNIASQPLERAARFAWSMLETIDRR